MSLRGSKTTEAISLDIEAKEIATLPLVARNDQKELRDSFLAKESGRNFRIGRIG